ncbi:hypothetical protein BJ170DRAFT_599787 [Xylariales sp. AK1849]|nr:hypothetical protein BJ170DRAFT_599787 [Xylariales sp. AK1849]
MVAKLSGPCTLPLHTAIPFATSTTCNMVQMQGVFSIVEQKTTCKSTPVSRKMMKWRAMLYLRKATGSPTRPVIEEEERSYTSAAPSFRGRDPGCSGSLSTVVTMRTSYTWGQRETYYIPARSHVADGQVSSQQLQRPVALLQSPPSHTSVDLDMPQSKMDAKAAKRIAKARGKDDPFARRADRAAKDHKDKIGSSSDGSSRRDSSNQQQGGSTQQTQR